MYLLLTVLAVFLIIVGCEIWWRKNQTHGEFSRKFVHITVGSFVAFWPFYLDWRQIQFLSIAFLIVVGFSKYLNFFQAIHSVQRPTLGELYFALAVGLVPFITHNKWVFMAAMLQMALADGMAAVIGERYGKQSYLVFGHRKSVAGSLTFYIISLAILVLFVYGSGYQIAPFIIVILSIICTAIENFAVKGLDNIILPVLVAVLLERVVLLS